MGPWKRGGGLEKKKRDLKCRVLISACPVNREKKVKEGRNRATEITVGSFPPLSPKLYPKQVKDAL